MEYVVNDLKRSLRSWRFWLLFGYHDAYGSLRRTRFGFLYYTFQTLLRTTIIFLVLGPAIAPDSSEYFAYLALGLPLFGLYSGSVTSGYGILTRNKAILENGKAPFVACIFRFFIDAGIRFLFAMLVYLGFLLVHPETLTMASLLLVPGLLIAVLFILSVALFFMVIGAFFPDLSEVVNSIMGVMLFATPIFWYAETREGIRGIIAAVNPLTHLIAVVREPALGNVPDTFSYVYACSLTLLLLIGAIWLFAIARNWMIFKL